MRIATFNIDGFGVHRPSDRDRPERIPALRAMLDAVRADILCLQEVNAQTDARARGAPRTLSALDRLITDTVYEGFHRAVSEGPAARGPMDVHNLVVLSRYPIASHAQLWNDLVGPLAYTAVTAHPAQGPAASHRWDRPALRAEIDLEGGRVLHLFNLHLRAPLAAAIPGQKESAFVWRTAAGWAEGFFLAAVKRSGQALETRLAIDAILDDDPDALIAVCGDMNADLFEMPLRILSAGVDDTGNPTLAGRELTALERAAAPENRYTVIHAGRRLLLDHVLVSPALARAARRVEILNHDLYDEVWEEDDGATAPSNHAPIVAEFSI